MSEIRVGQGFDAHAFARSAEPGATDPEARPENAPLMLGCVPWPGAPRLEGHSDGDVVAHAVCDALLSAAGLGDLGANFGVDRPEWRGAAGEAFLRHVAGMLSEAGWHAVNVSVQLIGQKPRVGARAAEVSKRLSALVGAPVSFSATTTDHMGFLGRGEGLAALATALIARGRADAADTTNTANTGATQVRAGRKS